MHSYRSSRRTSRVLFLAIPGCVIGASDRTHPPLFLHQILRHQHKQEFHHGPHQNHRVYWAHRWIRFLARPEFHATRWGRDGLRTSRARENQSPGARGKITEYPNGVSKIEPSAFGITGPLRDLPISDPDAAPAKAEIAQKSESSYCEKKVCRKKKSKGTTSTGKTPRELRRVLPGAGAGEGPFQDPLITNRAGPNAPQAMPTPGLTFNGATSADNADCRLFCASARLKWRCRTKSLCQFGQSGC